MQRRPTAIEITLVFTAFIAVTYGFGIYLFASLVPEMRRDLGFDYGTVGLVTGIAQAGFLIASLLSGIAAPLIGEMRLILGAVVATSLSLLLMTHAGSTAMLGLLLTVMGAAAAAVWVPMVSICQQLIPARHQGKALGLMSSGTSYGVFINGVIVPPLVAGSGWRSVWLSVGIGALLLLLVTAWRLRHLAARSPADQAAADLPPAMVMPLGHRLRLVLRPVGLLMIATMFLNGLACMPFQTYLVPLMREDFGWTVENATRVWSLIGATGMVGGFALGWLADRITIKWAMLLTYLLLAGGALIAFAMPRFVTPNILLMNGAGILFGLAFYAIFGLVPAYISAVFRGDAATLLFGIGNIALGLGGLLGNLIGGYAKTLSGSFSPIYGIVTLAAFGLVLLALLTPRERRQVKLSGQVAVTTSS